MDQEITLLLSFFTETDKDYTITVRDPKADLTLSQVVSAMEDIIDSDVFLTSQGESLAAVGNCCYRTVTKTPLTDPGGGE